MLRRDFIRTIAISTSLGAIGVGCRSSDSTDTSQTSQTSETTPASAKGEPITLRLHQFLPPMATLPKQVLKPWGERIEKASGGRLVIQHFDSMALGGTPPQLIDQARDGVADIVVTLTGYTPGRFPRTEVLELPFMMTSPVATSKAFWTLVAEDWQSNEYKDVKLIGAWVHGPGVIHTSKGVKKLEDMKGKKLRGPTRVINDLLKEMGATPVGMPLPAVAEALSKGVVDGTVIPWEVTPAIKLAELVKKHTEFGGKESFYTATIVMAMNKAKYDSLPADLKTILDAESGLKLSGEAADLMLKGDVPARKIATDAGNEITTLDETEVARWKAAAKPVVDRWVEDMKGRDVDGAALIEKARSLIAKNE
jgi:TRAP-type C4-dicarboxylate transport system substrate-binding protein